MRPGISSPGLSRLLTLLLSEQAKGQSKPRSPGHDLFDVMSWNGKEGVPIALRKGLLIVGHCPNGDPVAIDLKTGKGAIGYICHETMWSADDIRDDFLPIAASFGKLAAGLAANHLPEDYFEARERKKKLNK